MSLTRTIHPATHCELGLNFSLSCPHLAAFYGVPSEPKRTEWPANKVGGLDPGQQVESGLPDGRLDNITIEHLAAVARGNHAVSVGDAGRWPSCLNCPGPTGPDPHEKPPNVALKRPCMSLTVPRM
jgi:hypothetical protein